MMGLYTNLMHKYFNFIFWTFHFPASEQATTYTISNTHTVLECSVFTGQLLPLISIWNDRLILYCWFDPLQWTMFQYDDISLFFIICLPFFMFYEGQKWFGIFKRMIWNKFEFVLIDFVCCREKIRHQPSGMIPVVLSGWFWISSNHYHIHNKKEMCSEILYTMQFWNDDQAQILSEISLHHAKNDWKGLFFSDIICGWALIMNSSIKMIFDLALPTYTRVSKHTIRNQMKWTRYTEEKVLFLQQSEISSKLLQ